MLRLEWSVDMAMYIMSFRNWRAINMLFYMYDN